MTSAIFIIAVPLVFAIALPETFECCSELEWHAFLYCNQILQLSRDQTKTYQQVHARCCRNSLGPLSFYLYHECR